MNIIDNTNINYDTPWLSLSKFEAKTTLVEKVSRTFNNLVFVTSFYSLYALATGDRGTIAYASFTSALLFTRKIAATVIGYCAYPAARMPLDVYEGSGIEKEGKAKVEKLLAKGFIVKKIPLCKSGTKYDAYCIAHCKTIENGRWMIHALGNGMLVEERLDEIAKKNFKINCNTLLINGPAAAESEGWPTPYQMRAGFEAGIGFLESEVKATHIIMHGYSLGAGMLGEAVLNYDFTDGIKKGIKYLFISDRSFSRLSSIAAALVSSIAIPIFSLTGTELDGVGAAKKLSDLTICQIVIQHTSKDGKGNDGLIPDSKSLAYKLHKNKINKHKIFLESPSIDHKMALPENIEEKLNRLIKKFLE